MIKKHKIKEAYVLWYFKKIHRNIFQSETTLNNLTKQLQLHLKAC